MEADYVQRLRMIFKKDGAARYISHLDLARALERALNRAKIPMAYTHGFNRRPRMQMATALPLGYTSEFEVADILLKEELEPEAVRQRLMAKMAPGIDVYEMFAVALKLPSLQASTISSSYQAIPLDPVAVDEVQARVAEMLAAETLIRQKVRKKKVREYDLRPLILSLEVVTLADGQPQIQMDLMLQPSLTGRPDEVLKALGFDPLDMHIHRTMIQFQDGS